MNTSELILRQIYLNPGVYFRKLLRETGIAVGQLQQHLHKLQRSGKIDSFTLFRFRCYCSISVEKNDRLILGLLQHPVCKNILEHLMQHDGNHCTELAEHIRLAPSTLSWYLNRLEVLGVLCRVRHGKKYCLHLTDVHRVKEVLQNYAPSLLQQAVSGFLDAWSPR